MDRNRLFPMIAFLLAALLFACGIGELLIMRFEKGDVYPPYSSFRSDPRGTRAFLEGLGLVQGVTAVRSTVPLAGASAIEGSTLFLIGLDERAFGRMDAPTVRTMEEAARKGARIVIAFAPLTHEGEDRRPMALKERQEGSGKGKEGSKDEDALQEEYVDLWGRWEVGTRLLSRLSGRANLVGGGQGFPLFVDWRSPLVFEPHHKDWRPIYEREGSPVLLERPFGKGEIVLASDAFFLSNEAMKKERLPHLLSWLCGDHRRIIFDETHLGIAESPGLAKLIERHGLTPFFISLIVLIALALWRASIPLVPARSSRHPGEISLGRDHLTGLANLLRRNIPRNDVVAACVNEWENSFSHGGRDVSFLISQMSEIVQGDLSRPRRMRSPVDAYRRISRLVARPKARRGETEGRLLPPT